MARKLAELLEKAAALDYPLSLEGKAAHYDVSVSRPAAYVLDQLYVHTMLGASFLAADRMVLYQETVVAALKNAMEYVARLENELADLKGARAHRG